MSVPGNNIPMIVKWKDKNIHSKFINRGDPGMIRASLIFVLEDFTLLLYHKSASTIGKTCKGR